jgi:hypothetical protein
VDVLFTAVRNRLKGPTASGLPAVVAGIVAVPDPEAS